MITSKDSVGSPCGDEHEFILAYTEVLVTDDAPAAGLGSSSPPLLFIVYSHKLQAGVYDYLYGKSETSSQWKRLTSISLGHVWAVSR